MVRKFQHVVMAVASAAFVSLLSSCGSSNESEDFIADQDGEEIETPYGIGTGFFINNEGLALTNNHVLADTDGLVWLYSDDPDDSKVYAVHEMGDKTMQNTNYGIDILHVRDVLDAEGLKYGGK